MSNYRSLSEDAVRGVNRPTVPVEPVFPPFESHDFGMPEVGYPAMVQVALGDLLDAIPLARNEYRVSWREERPWSSPS